MNQIATIGGIAAPDSVFTRQATALVARVHNPKVAEIGPELVDETVGRYPRFGFKKALQQAPAEVAAKKPAWATGTGLADIGRRHLHGFQCADTCDLIDSAPFES